MEAWAVVEHGKPLAKVTVPMPEPIGTEILVEVTHCGVCHSDVHLWEGFYDLGEGKRFNISERGVKLPRAPGHEIVGIVAKLGPDAKGVEVGSRRIVYPWLGCGDCRRCQQNEDNLCANQKSLGLIQDGGFATHVLVSHPKYLIDPGNVDPATACTFACSGITALGAIRKIMPMEPEEPVVLIGTGGVGLSAISALRALGYQTIISIDLKAENRQAAINAGAIATLDGSLESVEAEVLKAAGGPVLRVIDFVNNSKTAPMALALLQKGGKLVLVGVMGGQMTLSLVGLVLKGATIMASLTGTPEDLREVASLAKEGKLLSIPVTTIPWDQANEAIVRLKGGKITGRLVLTRT